MMHLKILFPAWRLAGLFAALLCIFAPPSKGASAFYRIYVDEPAGFADLGPNGGPIHTYFKGGPLPGVGNTFNYDITLSPLISFNPGMEYQLTNPSYPGGSSSFLSMYIPTNLFTNLPSQNKQMLAKVIDGYDVAWDMPLWLDAHIRAGNIAPVAEFSLTLNALPPNLEFKGGAINFSTDYNYTSGTNFVLTGYFNRFLDADGNPYLTDEVALIPGQTLTVQLVPLVSISPALEPLAWLAEGRLNVEAIPEPSSVALVGLALGAVACHRWRRAR